MKIRGSWSKNDSTPILHLLGTGSALTSAQRDNTYLYLDLFGDGVLVDCGGSPGHKMQKLGYDLRSIRVVFLTHKHTDHIYGLPSLLHELWLLNKRKPGPTLALFGNSSTLEVVREWCQTFPFIEQLRLEMNELPDMFETDVPIWRRSRYQLFATAVCHEVPALGLKVVLKQTKKTLVYSGDTRACERLSAFARGAAYLVAEVGGGTKSVGSPHYHMTAKEVGKFASKVGVATLILVHVPPNERAEDIKRAAQEYFRGEIIVPDDLSSIMLV